MIPHESHHLFRTSIAISITDTGIMSVNLLDFLIATIIPTSLFLLSTIGLPDSPPNVQSDMIRIQSVWQYIIVIGIL